MSLYLNFDLLPASGIFNTYNTSKLVLKRDAFILVCTVLFQLTESVPKRCLLTKNSLDNLINTRLKISWVFNKPTTATTP